MTKTNAFTLIELLVSIAIIGVLTTISVSTFGNYMSSARDAKRIHQFKQTVDILKQYVIANEQLPTLTGSTSPAICSAWRVTNKEYKEQIIELGDNHDLTLTEDYWDECTGFIFYTYPAGSHNCPAENGDFLIFAMALESIDNGDKTLADLGLGEYDTFRCITGAPYWGFPGTRTYSGKEFRINVVFAIFENGTTSSSF